MLWLLGVNLTAYREFSHPSVLIHHRHSLFIKWTLLCFSHKVMEVTMASCSTNCLTEYKMALQKCHSPALIHPTLYQRKGWHLLTTEACLILNPCLWLIITGVTMSWRIRNARCSEALMWLFRNYFWMKDIDYINRIQSALDKNKFVGLFGGEGACLKIGSSANISRLSCSLCMSMAAVHKHSSVCLHANICSLAPNTKGTWG